MSEPCDNCNGYGEVTAGDPDIGVEEHSIIRAKCEGTGNNLSGGVDKSQETRWQNGKDIPEGESLTAHKSGSELSPRQTSGSSVPPAQNTTPDADNRGPIMKCYEDYICGYCKHKGHWSPDCQLKADHEDMGQWYEERDRIEDARQIEEAAWAAQERLQRETEDQ